MKDKLHNGLWTTHKEVKQPMCPTANLKYSKGNNVEELDKSRKKAADYIKKNQAKY